MKHTLARIVLCLLGWMLPMLYQSQTCVVKGKIKNEFGKVVDLVTLKINDKNLTFSNKYGEFELKLAKGKNYKLITSHLSYDPSLTLVKINDEDTIRISITLIEKNNELDEVSVISNNKPETLVGKNNYSIFDFDFFEDKFLLLTSSKTLKESADIRLTDYTGKEFSTYTVPKTAGEPQSFYTDYAQNIYLICMDSVILIEPLNENFITKWIDRTYFEYKVKPIKDTAFGNYYYSNQHPDYPKFSYLYFKSTQPDSQKVLSTVVNAPLLDLYNFEYYYLTPKERLAVRKMEAASKIDKHIIAATMSGFTRSLFYEPLYAPLFIVKDTICVFDHYSDKIFHYNSKNELIDSVSIKYHHPKSWRNWKRKLYIDKTANKIYAMFKNGAFVSLKRINYQTGKMEGVHKFVNMSAEKIKVKDGYAYYIYRPFESTQEKFLYRESIRLVPE